MGVAMGSSSLPGLTVSSLGGFELRGCPAGAGRVDAVRERPQRLVPGDASWPLPRHVASADVHVHGLPSVEALLEEPVGFGRSGLLAAPPFGLPSFFVCDPPTSAREVGLLDS